MHRLIASVTALATLFVCGLAGNLVGQQPRVLAPGALQVIRPSIDFRDVYSLPMAVPGLDAPVWTPNYFPEANTLRGQTQHVVLFRDVWKLEFSFLPVRQIELDITTPEGTPERRNVWYLIYRVRNVGQTVTHNRVTEPPLGHVEHQPQIGATELSPATLPNRFIGRFYLEGSVEDGQGNYQHVSYPDRVMPAVVRQIAQDAALGRQLLDTVEIAQHTLEPESEDSETGGLWGVAVWDNVDPRLDYVSVFVQGLTNAYRVQRDAESQSRYMYRTLQLNFWRPGDPEHQTRDRIHYGIPLVTDTAEQIRITELYNLPGPVLQVFELEPRTVRRDLLFELDAEVSLRDLQSRLGQQLRDGNLPDAVREHFAHLGIEIPETAAIETRVPDVEWSITMPGENEQQQVYILRIEPQYWERAVGGGIRFIRSLDHLWIYR